MTRTLRLFLLVAVLLSAVPLRAQNPGEALDVTKVEAGELIRFLQREVEPGIFFLPDTSDVKTYTVRAPRGEFLEKAFAQLKENGYTVTRYDGRWYVLRGKDLALDLPAGYFRKEAPRDTADDLRRYLDQQNAVMTFQNKIYEIGDPEKRRSGGRATVRGYVRDVATGEPITGVSVYDDSGRSYATTDEYGFYKITLPVGENKLGDEGESLLADRRCDYFGKHVASPDAPDGYREGPRQPDQERAGGLRRGRRPEGGHDPAGRQVGR